jgi:3-methyladenine DNA glycosylase AlkD
MTKISMTKECKQRLLLKKDLKSVSSKEKAKTNAWFFKTGKGQYGEGDKFIGVMVPELRKISKKYRDLSLDEIALLLKDPIHEIRLVGIFILIHQYEKTNKEKVKSKKQKEIIERKIIEHKKREYKKTKKKLYNFYLKYRKGVNNWDLVDLSAPNIVGNYLLDNPKEKTILYKYAKSKDLWEKRIAIVATFTFIRNNQFSDTIKLSEILLNDKHDLIHKAVGWMLREVGKRDEKILEKFLKKYNKVMPRTMLRYSIEKFSTEKRRYYMKK